MQQSCGNHSFEIIFVSPFPLPNELNLPNVKFIRSYSSPSVCIMEGAELVESELILNLPDDAIFPPDAFARAIDLCNDYKTVVNARITEGYNYRGGHISDTYWYVRFQPSLHLPGIPQNYQIALGHIMTTGYWKEMGGLDCNWEYANYNSHDLMFRIQADGGRIVHSPNDCMLCDWAPAGAMKDHLAIEAAYEDDRRKFNEKYSDPNALSPDKLKLPPGDWKKYQGAWQRRFANKLYESYVEMIANA